MSERLENKDYRLNERWSEYFRFLVCQKAFILAFCVPAILATLLLTYAVSDKYVASTIFYYHPLETTILKQKWAEAFGSPLPATTFKVISQTLLDIAGSDVMLGPVVDEFQLDKKNKQQNQTWYRKAFGSAKDLVVETAGDAWSLLKYGRLIEEDPRQKAVKDLRKNLKIGSNRESYLFTISVKYRDPVKVTAIVNSLGARLESWLKQQDQLLFADKLTQLRSNIDGIEREMQSLRDERSRVLRENNSFSLSDETTRGVNNLYEMELEKTRYLGQIEEKQKQIDELMAELDNPQSVHVSAEDYRLMKSKRLFESIELKALKAKTAVLEKSLKSLEQKLQKMPQLQMQIDSLETKLSEKKMEFHQISEMYIESSERLAGSRSEVRILYPSIVSANPVQPIKIYHVAAAAFLSLITSIALVTLLEFFNVRSFLCYPETSTQSGSGLNSSGESHG